MPLYKRDSSDIWWCRGSVAGQPYRKTTGTVDREEAIEFEERERQRLWRLHKLGDKSSVLWGDVAKRWMEEKATKRSKDVDQMILDFFAPHLNDEPISSIDRDAIDELRKLVQDDGEKTRSLSTVDRYMGLVRSILKACVEDWELLPKRPKVPMWNPERDEPRWLTHEEWDRLKVELPEHLRLAAHFAILTGLRMRAMLGLTWSRIDMASRRLWIPRLQQKGKRTHGIPLAPEALSVLKKLRKLNPEGDYVFQWQGQPIDDVNGISFQKALRRAKIEGANWHSFRHTFASWAVQRGVTLQELMELGDWKDIRSVLIYAHLAPDHLAQAASKISTKRAQPRKRADAEEC
jgi:integrase